MPKAAVSCLLCALLTLLPIMVLGALTVAVSPDTFNGTKSFITVTGLNLLLLLFYVVKIRVLLHETTKSLKL
ncbi:MAG: hypothetical protein R3C56_33375 [Pirellulaceae bacterium]